MNQIVLGSRWTLGAVVAVALLAAAVILAPRAAAGDPDHAGHGDHGEHGETTAAQQTSAAELGTFAGPVPSTAGVHLAVFSGGTLNQALAGAPTAQSVWVTEGGRFIGHVTGAPSFVNAAFAERFPDAIPANTPMLLALRAASADAYEVWALDQGTRQIHILDAALNVVDVIDLDGVVQTPHMIDFTSDHAYAFVANVGSGDVAVIRTADREVIEVIPTGAMTHMAAVVPGDGAVIVANMGPGTLTEILLDLENEVFTIGRELRVADDPMFAARASQFPGSSPVCHDFTADGRYAYVTLGPALANGGLVVLDTQTFELVAVYPPNEVSVNCGALLSPDGSKMYLNGGSLAAGHWYVFNTATHQRIGVQRSSNGMDAHGVMLTVDGSELWMVNRATSNAIIVNTATDQVIHTIDFAGPSPDIVDRSPDGRFIFVTLRGPNPLSGPHAIAGETPGIAVLDVHARELVRVIEIDPGNDASDFHGMRVRLLNP